MNPLEKIKKAKELVEEAESDIMQKVGSVPYELGHAIVKLEQAEQRLAKDISVDDYKEPQPEESPTPSSEEEYSGVEDFEENELPEDLQHFDEIEEQEEETSDFYDEDL